MGVWSDGRSESHSWVSLAVIIRGERRQLDLTGLTPKILTREKGEEYGSDLR